MKPVTAKASKNVGTIQSNFVVWKKKKKSAHISK